MRAAAGDAERIADNLTDDFRAVDHRKIVGMPERDRAAFAETTALLGPDVEVVFTEVIERERPCALYRVGTRNPDGSEWESVQAAVFRDGKWTRTHVFDPSDLAAARATYERLLAERRGV